MTTAGEQSEREARSRSLRRELIALIVFALVPMLVFSLVVALWGAWLQARSVESGVRNTTSALALAVSREVESWKATLRTAAMSRLIDDGDFTALHQRLAPLGADYDSAFALIDTSGRPLLNTAVRPGAALPPVPRPEWITHVVESGKPWLTHLHHDSVSNSQIVAVYMPVVRDGRVVYVLSLSVRPERLNGLLASHSLPREWRAMLLDGEQRVIARSDRVHAAGTSPPQWIVERDPADSVAQGKGEDGRLELVSLEPLRDNAWTVAVAMPRAAIDRDSALILAAMTIGGVALLALAVWLSGRVASRIEEPVRALALRAERGFSASSVPSRSSVREVQELERAFERAAVVERERAAEREHRLALQAANRAKDEFLATLSHELRTPLQAALGWLHVLRLSGPKPETHEQAVPVIERNLRQLGQLVEDLIDASRIVSGKVALQKEPLNLARLVQQTVETWQPALSKKNQRLRLQLDRELWIEADRARMGQVLSNLVANSVKFTPAEGEIEIRLARDGAHAELTVSDTGAGIEPHALSMVFNKFWQAEGGSDRRYQGLGLGLAIVKSLVELQGGSVTAASEGAGAGSTFTVRLPLVAPPTDALKRPAPDTGRTPLAGQRLLLVDDEVDAGSAVAQLLQINGADVTLTHSADEALQALSSQSFVAVMTDIAMPGEDGFDLLREIRRSGYSMPVLALTAFAADPDRERIAAAGFDGILTKPVHPDELVATLVSKLP